MDPASAQAVSGLARRLSGGHTDIPPRGVGAPIKRWRVRKDPAVRPNCLHYNVPDTSKHY